MFDIDPKMQLVVDVYSNFYPSITLCKLGACILRVADLSCGTLQYHKPPPPISYTALKYPNREPLFIGDGLVEVYDLIWYRNRRVILLGLHQKPNYLPFWRPL